MKKKRSTWRPALGGAAAGAGIVALLWLLLRGGGGEGSQKSVGRFFTLQRLQFHIDKRGVYYRDPDNQAVPIQTAEAAVAIARAENPAVVELFATGDAIVNTIRALKSAFIAAGFNVIGNQPVMDV